MDHHLLKTQRAKHLEPNSYYLYDRALKNQPESIWDVFSHHTLSNQGMMKASYFLPNT
jgi:hypothetical protein